MRGIWPCFIVGGLLMLEIREGGQGGVGEYKNGREQILILYPVHMLCMLELMIGGIVYVRK